eukprot:GHVT01053989.1.p1 GENE.GHVT01053989.1~~GHVT01053989.1.p1  ORF type:complete len:250 (-),score=16.32 GHVT01053989.1:1363-2112(-)
MTQIPLSPFEVEHLVKNLEPLKLEDYGGPEWTRQHETLQRLNILAHQQAAGGSDEFVVDIFATAEKVNFLIRELIVTEVWKNRCLPFLKTALVKLSSLRTYVTVFHEATLVNLLEVLFFHRTACISADDTLVDLVDYLYRKVTHLESLAGLADHETATEPELSVDASPTELQDLERHVKDCEFRLSIGCLSILRFITDHRQHLPITITSRLLHHHDILLAIVPLFDKRPWCRSTKNGGLEKFEKQTCVV